MGKPGGGWIAEGAWWPEGQWETVPAVAGELACACIHADGGAGRQADI